MFDEGLTLSGARKRLDEDGGKSNGAGVQMEDLLGDRVRDRLRNVRTGLQSILQLLSKDAADARGIAAGGPDRRQEKDSGEVGQEEIICGDKPLGLSAV